MGNSMMRMAGGVWRMLEMESVFHLITILVSDFSTRYAVPQQHKLPASKKWSVESTLVWNSQGQKLVLDEGRIYCRTVVWDFLLNCQLSIFYKPCNSISWVSFLYYILHSSPSFLYFPLISLFSCLWDFQQMLGFEILGDHLLLWMN